MNQLHPLDLQFNRAQLRKLIRRFFDSRGFIEVETPCLVPMPGTETYLNYFESDWQNLAGVPSRLFLRSSPELHMKQIIASSESKDTGDKDLKGIYQLGPCFRNRGELGPWHHPEFTMLEWYQQRIGYQGLIKQTEELIRYCHDGLKDVGLDVIQFPDAAERYTVREAFFEFADVELIDRDPDLAKKAMAAGVVSVRSDDDFDTAFFKVLLEKIEPAFAGFPLAVLYDYPASQAALAVVEKGVARRFEYFISGIEISNAFLELGGRIENLARIQDANTRRHELGLPVPPIDEDFLQAMDADFRECGGNALGFDRLLALLTGKFDLDAIIPFRFSSIWKPHFPS